MSKRSLFITTTIVLALTLTSFAVTQSGSKDEIIENPTPYSELLPENYRATILSADTIEWVLIDGWILNDSLIYSLGEPVGEILLRKLAKDSIGTENLKKLLLDPSAFHNDSVVKECTYIRDVKVF